MAWHSAVKQFFRGKKGLFFSLRPLRLQMRLYEPTEHEKLVLQMDLHGIDLVYDVGANKGQFGSNILAAGYEGKVVSFEPLSEAHLHLTHVAQKHANWRVAPRCAVGSESGETTINVSGNSQSSSMLDLTAEALAGSPTAQFVRSEHVSVIRLDDTDYHAQALNIFIKVDTQGFEMEVLKGATRLLASARGVQLEMSFTPMYEGAPTFETLYDHMVNLGFELWGMDTAFRDPKTRRLYQVDATFFRKS